MASEAVDTSSVVTSGDAAATDNSASDAALLAGSSEDAAEITAEIEELQAKVRAMEEEEQEEAKRMNELSGGHAPSNPVGSGSSSASKAVITAEQMAEQDSRSVHVAQVDYAVTEEELKELFTACGPVTRVTILRDRYTGQPKGFAYVEFQSADSIENAKLLNETEFKGRVLKVTAKRTNIPGYNRGGRGGGGGRGGRGRGGPRGGGFGGAAAGGGEEGGYGPIRGGRGGGRGGRGRGGRGGGFHPYQY